MNISWRLLLAAAVTGLAALDPQAAAQAQPASSAASALTARALKLSGTITDGAGQPVSGATVEYWRYEGAFIDAGAPTLGPQALTGADGAYEFSVRRGFGFLLARKPGLAPAWRQLGPPFNQSRETNNILVLTPPGRLTGRVVDESNQPATNAEVFATMAFSGNAADGESQTAMNFFTGKPAQDCFSTRTDTAGHFSLEGFPTNAKALLSARSPGKTLRPGDGSFDPETSGYRAGQEDIKLVVEPAGGVEGTMLGRATNPPLPVARLSLQPDEAGQWAAAGIEPTQSDPNGAFKFEGVAAGAYHIHATFGTNGSDEWVAEATPVVVASGQVARGVRVTARHGTLLEVAVVSRNEHRPLARINVTAYQENSQFSAVTDRAGRARLRLLPGSYQIAVLQEGRPAAQTSATVTAETTRHVEVEIAAARKITGVVRGLDGQAAAGVGVQMMGGFGPPHEDVETDADGSFAFDWNPRPMPGSTSPAACVLVRDPANNLAAAQEVEDETAALELKLAPGLTLAGRVEAAGRPVTNLIVRVIFWMGNRGTWLPGAVRTNAPGQYEIPALPPGRKYGVEISAPGYGQKRIRDLEALSESGRQELETVELVPANLPLAGKVLDADDKPVAGCNVQLNGDGQPSAFTRSDREGRFSFTNTCAGPAQVFAHSPAGFGTASAQGGETNVVVQLGENSSFAAGAQSHKVRGLITDPAGQPDPGAQVALFPGANGAHWTPAGPGGEYSLDWSALWWQMRNGVAGMIARDASRDLAVTAEVEEDITNLDLKLKPALSLAGQVRDSAGAPRPGATMGLGFKIGNSYAPVDEGSKTTDAAGRYEIKCLPADGEYLVWATAKGYGRSEQEVELVPETNRLELPALVLKLADQVIAGQILQGNDQPAANVSVSVNGEGQPEATHTTDSKGQFHFQVCAGQIRLFAFSLTGGGNAQTMAEAGDTNIVMTLRSQTESVRSAPIRHSLKGGALPDLATVGLTRDAAPAGKALLLCLFDAGQRPSRHALHLLDQQAAALGLKNIRVLGVQAARTSDDVFNQWKSTSPMSFAIGRVTDKSDPTQWPGMVGALPWLILTDPTHQVVAEGFPLEDLDVEIEKLGK